MNAITWLGQYEEDGEVAFRLGRAGDELIAEWPTIATLRANVTTGAHRFDAVASADPVLVEKVRASLARALLRHLEHKLTLHGSAFTEAGRALAVVGQSGAGKSTLSAAVARAPGVGFAADDTIALELDDARVRVMPTETVSWLLPDAQRAVGEIVGEGKHPVPPPRVAEPAELVAIVVPRFRADARGVTVERLRGTEILSALVPCVVRFVIDDPRVQLRELEQLTRLVERVPVYALDRPRDLGRLDESVRVVRTILAAPLHFSPVNE